MREAPGAATCGRSTRHQGWVAQHWHSSPPPHLAHYLRLLSAFGKTHKLFSRQLEHSMNHFNLILKHFSRRQLQSEKKTERKTLQNDSKITIYIFTCWHNQQLIQPHHNFGNFVMMKIIQNGCCRGNPNQFCLTGLMINYRKIHPLV